MKLFGTNSYNGYNGGCRQPPGQTINQLEIELCYDLVNIIFRIGQCTRI